MRDHLCVEGNCKDGLEYKQKFINYYSDRIQSIKEDIKNENQKLPKDSKSIIEESYLSNFSSKIDVIRGKYSLGQSNISIENDFNCAISDLDYIGNREVAYLKLLWAISLGLLLETDKQNMKRLAKIVERQNMEDFVVDYLLLASDIGWKKVRNIFEKEVPYTNTKEIIELAEADKKEASKRLQTYMENEWFQGHYDYEWRNAHKRRGYLGFWSFETAAIAKILKLDDSTLKDNNHYPYDLVHYKNSMTFKDFTLSKYLIETDIEEPEDWEEGIENNPALEKIIPIKWHSFVNELISDYQTLDDDQFYEKYKEPMELNQIWFFKDEYKEENKEKNLLGSLIVFALTQRDFILQLDYKDDLEDYVHIIKNFWKESETKLIQFMLDNDQNYYALVPKDVDIRNMYEVIVKDVG
ncbi:PoNe immunity protein domain-containing protein [Pseudogracilibacillus sp. SO30301A]|uniref:PoNe immunity protein domain-containing protein n=1 Tax=Pseudogracilibacillus sp. SO30301A TaxID=3098291 RepID=UPI00300E349E